jgi:hypothetical protein
LLILLLMHVYFLYFGNLPQKILLIDGVAYLVHLRQLVLEEAPHLKHTEHFLLLKEKSVVVRQELNLKGVWEFLNHLIIEEVEEFGQETLLCLININLIDGLLPFFV